MGQERLNGLSLRHVHFSTNIDFEEVLNMFARKHPRRLTLL